MNNLTPSDELTDFLLYTAPDGAVKIEVILQNESVWLTQKAIAQLFGVNPPAISKHLTNIYDSGELDKTATVSILEIVSTDEIKQLERSISAFFDYIERIIENRNAFTMQAFADSVNKFLDFNEYRILSDKGKISAEQAKQKAFNEYEQFNKTQHIVSDFDKLLESVKNKEKQ